VLHDQRERSLAVLVLDELRTDGAQLDVHRRSSARELVLRRAAPVTRMQQAAEVWS
jgi:hypothetical protein